MTETGGSLRFGRGAARAETTAAREGVRAACKPTERRPRRAKAKHAREREAGPREELGASAGAAGTLALEEATAAAAQASAASVATAAAKAAIEANGGTMIGAWMAFGSDDLVVVADMPDDASMAGVALAVSATGAIEGGKTTKLLDIPTAVEGMKKAKAVLDVYQPPS